MIVAFIVAVVVGLVVKVGLSLFAQTKQYADPIAFIVAVVVFLVKAGFLV